MLESIFLLFSFLQYSIHILRLNNTLITSLLLSNNFFYNYFFYSINLSLCAYLSISHFNSFYTFLFYKYPNLLYLLFIGLSPFFYENRFDKLFFSFLGVPNFFYFIYNILFLSEEVN